MRHATLLVLIVLSSVALGYASIELRRKMQPPRLTLGEEIAIRKTRAHDAAVKRNAAAREACEITRALRPPMFGILYGASPATPGVAFDLDSYGHHIGDVRFDVTRRGEELLEARAVVTEEPNLRCWPNEDPEVFCPFRCTNDPKRDCLHLGWQLERTWGSSLAYDRTSRIRARVVEQDNCQLRFQRYVEPSRWIAMTETAEVPLALIGAHERRLPAHAGFRYFADVGWQLFITGEHMIGARLGAYVKNQRITGFLVWGNMDEDGGADELHALVRRYLGGPLNIELRTHKDSFELFVGDVPERDTATTRWWSPL